MIHSYAAAYAEENSGSSDFIPIPALQIKDADITLIMLVNCAEYTAPVSDSWFYAHEKGYETVKSENVTRYWAWPPSNVMACTVQHQVCSVGPNLCSPFMGLSQLKQYNLAAEGSVLEPIWYYFLRALGNTELDYMTGTLGSASLQAEANVSYAQRVYSAPLPDLQWQTEVVGWVQFTLSNVQRLLYQFANGPSDLSLSSVMTKPPYRDAFDVCHAQKIKDSNYYCFSVLGLVFTLASGLLIIIVNFSLPTVVGWTQHRANKGTYKKQQWTEDYVLHIQRLAYQNLGIGNWHGHDHAVPTTDAEELVGRPTRLGGQITGSTTEEFKHHDTSVTVNSFGIGYSPVYGDEQPSAYNADRFDPGRAHFRDDGQPFLPHDQVDDRGRHGQHDLWAH